MKNLTKAHIEKNIAAQPYKLVVDCPYSGGRTTVAHGSYDDLEFIKSVTMSNLNLVIVENV